MNQAVYGKQMGDRLQCDGDGPVRKKVLKLSDEPYTITLVDDTKEMLVMKNQRFHYFGSCYGGSTSIEPEQGRKYENHQRLTTNECDGRYDTAAENTASHVFGKDELKDVVASQDAYLLSSGALTIGAAFLTKNINYLL